MFGNDFGIPAMTEAQRRRIGAYIEGEFGIKMPASKKSLLEGRLAKRLRATGSRSYDEYFDLVTKAPGDPDEYLHFIDLISTHETSFFREPKHFQLLASSLLPALCADRGRRSISVMSAACSTGEEAWTLAMLVDDALETYRRRDMGFTVEGFDISTKALGVARRGVYLDGRTKSIPMDLQRNYLMASKDRSKGLRRFIPELRACVSFHEGNLLGDLGLNRKYYDIVFCRNVLIYFDQARQREVISTLLRRMNPGSYLFLGHSETMQSFGFPIRSIAHAAYQKS
jgi:chemotaxis protein methyltransferase CheR